MKCKGNAKEGRGSARSGTPAQLAGLTRKQSCTRTAYESISAPAEAVSTLRYGRLESFAALFSSPPKHAVRKKCSRENRTPRAPPASFGGNLSRAVVSL
ncbi:unnamed protein product, partial [Iphiclides podalirius]